MKHLRDFAGFSLNEGAVKAMIYDIVDEMVDMSDSWKAAFEEAEDKTEFVKDELTNFYRNDPKKRDFVKDNLDFLAQEIMQEFK